jgi:hypothetical protein
MIEVRRPSDGELCGHVRMIDGTWQSLTVFGGHLGEHSSQDAAEEHVLNVGLASLAERWWLRQQPSAEWQIVCIQEANTDSVRVALGYYSLPGVPTLTITRQQMQAGATLTLTPAS